MADRISDKEAWNFGIIELMVMMVIGIIDGVCPIVRNQYNGGQYYWNLQLYYKIRIRFGYDSLPFKG